MPIGVAVLASSVRIRSMENALSSLCRAPTATFNGMIRGKKEEKNTIKL